MGRMAISQQVDSSEMAMVALPENTPEATVLVVDDETNIVELLSVSLKFQGFEVYTATNGSAALDKAREVRPDAVILDVMMPGMDGFGVLRRLRADGIDSPALFLTARDSLIEVCDEGPGMSAQDAHRVFERFYRADSSRARTSGGTGLGLSIVDSLVCAHGGKVAVTTAPGRGCRFTVSLPRIADMPAGVR